MATRTTAITLRREPGYMVRSLTALMLRLGFGLFLLMSGLSKFEQKANGTYPAAITDQFEGKHFHGRFLTIRVDVPNPPSVRLFANVLPYAETILGAALLIGFWTPLSAFLSGLLVVLLLFGHVVQQNVAQFSGMFVYLLVAAAILWLSPVTSNYFSLDALLFGWFWAPRPEGEYRADETVVVPKARKV
jgi:uncharacterized membrane protein YphA (DoxX/SURF4 family)